MYLSKMNVDKFGIHLYKRKSKNDEYWWKDTKDGNVSARNKIIKHLRNPIDAEDSATKGYVDNTLESCLKKVKYLEQFFNEVSNRVAVLEARSKNEQSRRHK